MNERKGPFAVVLTCASSSEEAGAIASSLVERRLAACVNQTGAVRSVYRWKGEICSAEEHLLIIKTTVEQFPAVRDAICALHSYENPEVVLLSIADGAAAYLGWISENVGPEPGRG